MERRIKAKVKDGVIVVDRAEQVAIAEGAHVTVLVEEDELYPPTSVRLDEDGMPIWDAKALAELEESVAQADRGEGISAHVAIAEVRRKYRLK